jgi:hypothetical protein
VKKSRFSEAQIVGILKEAGGGLPIAMMVFGDAKEVVEDMDMNFT